MNEQEILLEEYKMFCKTADDITSRRLETNKFYLTIILGLFTIGGFLSSKEHIGHFSGFGVLILVSVIGLFLSIVWYVNIESYKVLNRAKFDAIEEMETMLPYACYTKEHIYKKERKTTDLYQRLTSVEKYLPIAFGIISIFIFIMLILFKG